MSLNFETLDKLIADQYINVQKHPTLDLYIYNYSHKAQYDNFWCEETESCRGLIMNAERWIIARPFKKFFNLSQVPNLPAEPFTVTEKWDGSLGIMHPGLDGLPAIATRGSFTSDQALRATAILRSKYADVLNKWVIPEYTYLFEIILPENRIVVDYGSMEDIVLLSVIVTNSGVELPYEQVKRIADSKGVPVVKQYVGVNELSELTKTPTENAEGYVVRFQSGLRVKIKFDEYVRLHRILTNVNAKAIWDMLRTGKSIGELIERVPDEFYQWVKNTERNLQQSYDVLVKEATSVFEGIYSLSRREFADRATKTKYRSILFAMLDGKDYSQIIWKMLKPKADKPFRIEE